MAEVFVLKIRIKFKKYGALRFIGHLDIMRYFQKAIRRAELPISYTTGYSPHMIMSFANPLGIGLTSEAEYFDIEIHEQISSAEAVRRLNDEMVEGAEVVSFRQISDEKKMTGMALVAAADYRVYPKTKDFPENLDEIVKNFMAQDEIRVVKKTKRSEKEVDIRHMLYEMKAEDNCIFIKSSAGSVENLKPNLVMQTLCEFMGEDPEELKFGYHRVEMYAALNEEDPMDFVSLEDLGTELL